MHSWTMLESFVTTFAILVWVLGFVGSIVWAIMATGNAIQNLSKESGPVKAGTVGVLIGMLAITAVVEIIEAVMKNA